MVKLEDFSKDKFLDYGKVFLVFYFKKYSWVSNLKIDYGISSKVIRESIEILLENDLIVENFIENLDESEIKNYFPSGKSFGNLLEKKQNLYERTPKILGDGDCTFDDLIQSSKYNSNLANFIVSLGGKLKDVSKSTIVRVSSNNFKRDFGNKKEVLKDLEENKVLLVLFFKGFSWQKELENEFNISNSVISKSISRFEKQGFIISKDFFSLDLDLQECVKRLSSAYKNSIRVQPKIYTLSVEGREYAEDIVEFYKLEAKNNSSLKSTIKFIQDKTRAYEKLMKKFNEEEDKMLYRKRVSDKGIVYETKTKRIRDFEKAIRIAKSEVLPQLFNNAKKMLGFEKKSSELVIKKKSEIEVFNDLENNYKKNKILYNNSEISVDELSELQKNKDKEIEKAPIEKGKSIDEVNDFRMEGFEKLKTFLGINPKLTNKKEFDGNMEIINNIISEIKEKGWMDSILVQRSCKTEENYRKFVEIAIENNIVDDGEDFRALK